MTVTIVEKVDTRRTVGGENPEHERKYAALGSSDEQEVKAALEAAVPATYDSMPLRSLLIEPTVIDETDAITNLWDCTAHWRLAQSSAPPQTGQSTFSFETGGGAQHISQSRATAGIYAPPGIVAPDFQGAIGVTDQGVEGVDVTVPVYQFSETHYVPANFVTPAYRGTLFYLTGRVNLFPFKGLDGGECLFLGVSASRRGTGINDDWEMTFRFAGSPNATVSVGPIVGIEKGGWQYLWVRYAETEDSDAKLLVQRPIAAYVEQVYEWGDFAALGIGVT